MRALWPWLRNLAALGILAALAWKLGAGAFLDGLRAISPGPALAALALGLLSTAASAARWHLVARGLGLPLPLGQAVSDYYRAQLLNAVLPAGVLGDVHRAVNHGRSTGELGRGVRAVVFERFAGQLPLITLGLLVVLTQATPGLSLSISPQLLFLIVAALAIGLAVLVRRVPAVRRELTATLADAKVLLRRGLLLQVMALSTVALAGHLAVFVLAARAAGVTAELWEFLPLLVIALLAMGLPVNVGGFGPREAVLAVGFAAAGLGAAQGVATGVVYGVLSLIAALPGALTLLPARQHRERLPERRHQPRQQLPALVHSGQ